jgi:hypothetical protein
LVQWGFSKRDTAEAEVLASGTEEEMKLKLHTTEKEKPATGKKRKRETTVIRPKCCSCLPLVTVRRVYGHDMLFNCHLCINDQNYN